jgi:predicted secreted protein
LSVTAETVTLDIVVPDLTGLPDEVSLQIGEEQTLLLPSSAQAGYVWEAESDDEAVVAVSTKFEGADDAAVGARTFSENERLTLKGLAEGETSVQLVQRRTWEEGVKPIAAHTIAVNVAGAAEATQPGGTT